VGLDGEEGWFAGQAQPVQGGPIAGCVEALLGLAGLEVEPEPRTPGGFTPGLQSYAPWNGALGLTPSCVTSIVARELARETT
jgi:hypothetical protein